MAGKDEENIPLGDGEEPVEVTLEESNVKETKKPEGEGKRPEGESAVAEAKKGPAGGDEDELAQYSEGVQKRINKLTFKQRETERQLNEALEITRRIMEENHSLKKGRVQADKGMATEYENRLKVQETLVKQALRAAIEANDSDKQADLQKELGTLAVEQERVRAAKVQIDAAERAFTQQPEQRQEQPRQQQQQPQVQPDPRAEDWASKNTWFGSDEPMTITAFTIHKRLVEQEGYDPTSDDYYAEIDSRMRKAFPHKFEEESKPEKKPSQTVASATRNTGAAPKNPNRVKLTSSQVAIAKKLGISLEDYARHYQKLNG